MFIVRDFRERIKNRKNDVSDADFAVFEHMERLWTKEKQQLMRDDERIVSIRTDETPVRVRNAVDEVLRQQHLLDSLRE